MLTLTFSLAVIGATLFVAPFLSGATSGPKMFAGPRAIAVTARTCLATIRRGANSVTELDESDGSLVRVIKQRRAGSGAAQRGQILSGTISMAPHGHSLTQMPQPLQKS